MGRRQTFILSISLTVIASIYYPSLPFFHKPTSLSTSTPKATHSDILSLLGPKSQSSKIKPDVANHLMSCLKFLIPFTPTSPGLMSTECLTTEKELGSPKIGATNQTEVDELIWWPPEPVLELARLAACSGDDNVSDTIKRALDPTEIAIPDVEGSKEHKCEVASSTVNGTGKRFKIKELNLYLEFLFKVIATPDPKIGLNISLNRYDLFHGHLFLAKDTGRLGILFHAKEYPAYDEEVFPYCLGSCQEGSNLKYDVDSMNLRNILWLAPLPSISTKAWVAPEVLVVLDAHPDGIIYRDLVVEIISEDADLERNIHESQPKNKAARNIDEGEFGKRVFDVNYLNVGGATPDYRIFIC